MAEKPGWFKKKKINDTKLTINNEKKNYNVDNCYWNVCMHFLIQ